MKYEEYKKAFETEAENEILVNYAGKLTTIEAYAVMAEMVLFTEDSSFHLAPPFPGGYGVLKMYDFRKTPTKQGKQRKNKKEVSQTELPETTPYSCTPTKAQPIKLMIIGGDDSSFTMMASEEKAFEIWELLTSMQPLHIEKDCIPLGFEFSN